MFGIYEAHQAFSLEELRLKVTLRHIASNCGHIETRLSDKLSHHHSIQLYDGSHDISPVRAAACAPPADSDNESGSEPLLVCCFCFLLLSYCFHAGELSVT